MQTLTASSSSFLAAANFTYHTNVRQFLNMLPVFMLAANPQTVQETTTMRRQNKYEYLHVVQGYYGHGWEDLTAFEDYREAQVDARAYRENDTAPIRIIKRRVLKAAT